MVWMRPRRSIGVSRGGCGLNQFSDSFIGVEMFILRQIGKSVDAEMTDEVWGRYVDRLKPDGIFFSSTKPRINKLRMISEQLTPRICSISGLVTGPR